MSKPKIPNQKNKYKELNNRLAGYVALVRNIYDALNLEAAKMVYGVNYDGIDSFKFSSYPQLKDRVSKLQNRFVSDMQSLIYSGISNEWKESNIVQDLLANKVLKTYGAKIRRRDYTIYYQNNSEALNAFQKRKDNGMNISQKLWNQSKNYKEELEYAISSAIQKGTSAVTLSKRLSKYLQDFDSLKNDYKEKYGKAVTCKDCEYRSIRLARSEINMAYRTAEQKRWEQMDFIVGYEIKLSHSHHSKMPHGDICDELAGKYPKNFKWTGWHPNDMCYVVPILKTEEEFLSDGENKSINEIDDIPMQLKNWISENKDRIKKSKLKKTLPYFLKENISYIENKDVKKQVAYFLSDQDKEYLQSMGVRFKGFGNDIAVKYNNSAIKGFNLKHFDDFIESLCDENEIRVRNKTITMFNNGNVNLIYTGRSRDGEVFVLARDFILEEGTRVVLHNNFDVPKSLQGNGMSKKVMKALFEQYENMGVDTIKIYANKDIGGYAWAKYGFSAIKEDAKFVIESAYNNSVISKDEFNFLKDIISKYNDLFPMNLIALMEKGKDILLGTWWNGIFNMKDKKQLAYLKDYIGF